MNQMKVFNFENQQIRTEIINGEPWFVGKDVADVLGYAKPLNAIAMHVDNDDSLKQGVIDSMGRMQQAIFINESGMYALVFGSKLEAATRFKKWVTSEVLPSIRKHGAYATENVLEQAIGNPDFMIGLLSSLKSEQEARKKAEQTIEAQRPKALVGEMLEVSQNSVSVKKLATIL